MEKFWFYRTEKAPANLCMVAQLQLRSRINGPMERGIWGGLLHSSESGSGIILSRLSKVVSKTQREQLQL